MIYVLKESVMNGTVTLSTTVHGVEEDDFNLAAVRVRDRLPVGTRINFVQDLYIEYVIQGQLPVVGRMESTPLKMLTDDPS